LFLKKKTNKTIPKIIFFDQLMEGNILDFQLQSRTNAIIKVIGVGGGGGNAVNHMYLQGIHDVSFALCNTDNQALMKSPVPVKVQLGQNTTGGAWSGK